MTRMTHLPSRLNLLCGSAILLCAAALLWLAIRLAPSKNETAESSGDSLPDTLRVAMLNAPYSFYDYRDTIVGYDYELIHALADSLHRPLLIIKASSITDLVDKVARGEADIAAGPVADTKPTQSMVRLCGPERISYQVLVQRRGPKAITDPSSLAGHTIAVEEDSRYAQRLRNLDSEIGGGIRIETIDRDTVSDADLVRMVDRGEIEMTVTDSDLAVYNAAHYPSLDFSMPLSMEQRLQWAVNPADTLLAAAVSRWVKADSVLVANTYRKYYHDSQEVHFPQETSKQVKDEATTKAGFETPATTAGIKSVPYKAAFKQVAARHGYDWRLLAAVAFVESRFKPDIVSWAGARGIMQVMPGTARAMGLEPGRLTDPAVCMEAGVRLLVDLDKSLSKRIPDPAMRRDFVLASYNAGMGHILDAIALARKYGLDASRWEGGVSRAALMKSKPKYYRDPVVKNGYFRARETVDFVHAVNAAYRDIAKLN